MGESADKLETFSSLVSWFFRECVFGLLAYLKTDHRYVNYQLYHQPLEIKTYRD